jgi:hypothetical protein
MRLANSLLLALGLAGPALGASTAAPEDGARAFYKTYLTIQSGGIPDAPTRAKLAPRLSDGLNRLLVEADKAEERHAKATKGEEPPLAEGDIFTSLFEGASQYDVKSCMVEQATAICAVALSADDGKGGKVEWTDQAILVRAGAGWRLDDVKYGGTWEFGFHGTLRQVLQELIQSK